MRPTEHEPARRADRPARYAGTENAAQRAQNVSDWDAAAQQADAAAKQQDKPAQQAMTDLHKERLHAWLRWGILGAVAVYALVTVICQQPVLEQERAHAAELAALEQELTEKEQYLNSMKEYVGTDAYTERLVREALGWVKEDEIVFREQPSDGA